MSQLPSVRIICLLDPWFRASSATVGGCGNFRTWNLTSTEQGTQVTGEQVLGRGIFPDSFFFLLFCFFLPDHRKLTGTKYSILPNHLHHNGLTPLKHVSWIARVFDTTEKHLPDQVHTVYFQPMSTSATSTPLLLIKENQ